MASKYTSLLADIQSVVAQIVTLTPSELHEFAHSTMNLISSTPPTPSAMEIKAQADNGDEASAQAMTTFIALQAISLNLLYPACKARRTEKVQTESQLSLIH